MSEPWRPAGPAPGDPAGRAPGDPAAPAPDPVLALLLDPDALSRIVGRDVRVTRVRPKPGVSHVAALVDAGSGAVSGWVQALIGEARVKRDKAVQRVAEQRPDLTLGETELPELDAHLLWGPVESDPRLVTALAGIDLTEGTLLRYNPHRRVVLRLGDHVVRVTARPHRDRLSGLARALAAAGAPVTTPVSDSTAGVPGGRRTTVWPWVEGRDLSSDATPAQLAEVGRLLARLHAVSPGAVPDLPRRGWAELRQAAAESVAQVEQVAPLAAGPLRLALDALPVDEPPRAGRHSDPTRVAPRGGSDVVLHGDFSLDQCLAAEDRLVITDLDRAAFGPAEVDLASVLAVALLEVGDCGGLRPLLESYRAATATGLDGSLSAAGSGGGPPSLAPAPPWVAASLLTRTSEPWRSQRPGWEEQTAALAGLALDLLDVAPTLPSDPLSGPDPVDMPAKVGLSVGSGPDDRRRTDLTLPSDPLSGPDPVDTPAKVGLSVGSGPDDRRWTVPPVVESAGYRVEVLRAWPDKVVDGVPRVAIEGPDQRGRLRAGRVDPTGQVKLLPAGEDPRLPSLSAVAQQGRLVVHRPGRRAVVALPDSFVKVVRPGRAAQIADLSRRGAELAAVAGLGAARVLHADDDTIAFSVLPGRPVHDLSEQPGWEDVWSLWARAWARLQAATSDAATDLPEHGPVAEAGVLQTWRTRALDVGVLAGTPWPDRLATTAQALTTPVADLRLVPAHRDLHDKQLLWDGTTLSVLDLDTASRAEPALDLANLAVHARLRHAQGLWSAGATGVVLAAVADVAEASGVAPDRMRLAERATVARLAAVYAFRPPWRDSVLRWAEQEWDELTGDGAGGT